MALARACYAGAEVALLDDPLSAVDAHVQRTLMQEVVCGVLGKATRVLVTHQLQFLPQADLIVKMERGRVVATGTYSELVSQGVELSELKFAAAGAQHTAIDSPRHDAALCSQTLRHSAGSVQVQLMRTLAMLRTPTTRVACRRQPPRRRLLLTQFSRWQKRATRCSKFLSATMIQYCAPGRKLYWCWDCLLFRLSMASVTDEMHTA